MMTYDLDLLCSKSTMEKSSLLGMFCLIHDHFLTLKKFFLNLVQLFHSSSIIIISHFQMRSSSISLLLSLTLCILPDTSSLIFSQRLLSTFAMFSGLSYFYMCPVNGNFVMHQLCVHFHFRCILIYHFPKFYSYSSWPRNISSTHSHMSNIQLSTTLSLKWDSVSSTDSGIMWKTEKL